MDDPPPVGYPMPRTGQRQRRTPVPPSVDGGRWRMAAITPHLRRNLTWERRVEILIAGESWTTHTIHVKGFDSFTTSGYGEGVQWLRAALEAAGHRVDFMPNHRVS